MLLDFTNYINLFLVEPLEQFDIVKINYEWWYYNSIIESFITAISIYGNYTTDVELNCFEDWTEVLSLTFLSEFENSIINVAIPFSFVLIFSTGSDNTIFISNYDFFDSYLLFSEFVINQLIWGITFNSTIYFFSLLLIILVFFFLPITKNLQILPTNWQFIFENLYKFINEMLEAQIGKEAQRFFPYIFVIFSFILTSNMLGMTLFSFTLTSHIMVTFTLGVSTFIGLTILGFVIQKLAFLYLFLPQGIPSGLLPMLVVIEIISYFSRALSLSIRLFANLMSGHTLLHILAFFSSKLFKYNFIVGMISFILILAIVALEFCIAILQAYVFAILICIYLNDSFHVAH